MTEQERLWEELISLRERVTELETGAGITAKSVELEVKAIHQMADQLVERFESYASDQRKRTGVNSEELKSIGKDVSGLIAKVDLIEKTVTATDVEVNVGDKINAGGDYVGRDKSNNSTKTFLYVVGGLVAVMFTGYLLLGDRGISGTLPDGTTISTE